MRFLAKRNFFFWFALFMGIWGLLVLYSGSSWIALQKKESSFYFVKSQFLKGFLPGVFFLIFFSKISLNFLKKISFVFYIFSLGLIILTFIPQFQYKWAGASRWVKIGGIVFQPTEIAKLSLILCLGTFLERKIKKREIKKFKEGFLSFLFLVLPLLFLCFLQPDMGSLLVLASISFSMFFLGGGNILHILLAFFLLGTVGVVSLILHPYQMERVLSFLGMIKKPLEEDYQIKQALIGIGSGGILGKGYLQGLQKYFYLPQPMGDTIFAIFGEEFGFWGAICLLFLWFLFLFKAKDLFLKTKDIFEKLVIGGTVSFFLFQSFFHIMGNLKLLPFSGLTLPFFSYGGTSLIVVFSAMGILTNISRRIGSNSLRSYRFTTF